MPQILKTPSPEFGLAERVHDRLFDLLTRRTLLYNTCWEDPAVDRQALRIGPGGHNAGHRRRRLQRPRLRPRTARGPIHAVNVNPRQTALLELKIAGIRAPRPHGTFFALFGRGPMPRIPGDLSRRASAPAHARRPGFWDGHRGVVRGEGEETSSTSTASRASSPGLVRLYIARPAGAAAQPRGAPGCAHPLDEQWRDLPRDAVGAAGS